MRESVARHLAQHVSQGNMKSREQAGPQGLVDRHPVQGERTWAKAYPEPDYTFEDALIAAAPPSAFSAPDM